MTKKVTISDAQIQFPKLIKLSLEGNEVIIVKNNKPLIRFVPVSSAEHSRVEGLNQGKIWISKDFDEPLSDEFWMSK